MFSESATPLDYDKCAAPIVASDDYLGDSDHNSVLSDSPYSYS